MNISKVVKTTGDRYKVFGDGEYLFSLYFNELKKYNITEDKDVPNEIVEYILSNIIYKRGKERALYLLEQRPYSEFTIRQKLFSSGYPEKVTDDIISFLKEYNYLNDSEYVSMYVQSHHMNKSRRQIEIALMAKGIDRQLISDCFENCGYSDNSCFLNQFNKYIKGKDINDPVVRRKTFRYFYGKGFSSELINNTMRNNAQ